MPETRPVAEPARSSRSGPEPSNLAIDDRLLDHARAVGGCRTKRETVNEALREFIRRRERLELLRLVGTIEYDPRYGYKKERRPGIRI